MTELKIKNNIPVQEDFWGNGAVYHAYAGMPDDAGRIYSEELCDLEADRAGDMKLKIARTYYYWWAWDKEKNVWNWESERMQVLYRWLKRMKDRNITVALNAGWCSPGDIDSSSWNGISPFTVKDDWKKSVENYADWVSETVHQLIEVRGFDNIKILVMFTEPNNGFGNIKAFNLWADAVIAADKALKRDGRRDLVKLMGSNEGSGIKSDMLKWVSENPDVRDIIDIYSSHTYQNMAAVPKRYIKTGKTSVTMTMAGGRVRRTIPLKPNTDYTVYADIAFSSADTKPTEGNVHFGVFLDDGRNDIHTAVGSGPAEPAAKGSTYSITPDELQPEYKRYSISFNSGDAESGVIGVFHDIKTLGITVVDLIGLCEKGSDVSVVPNTDFSDYSDGWTLYYAGDTCDAYLDWYKWAKTGLQYVPEGKPFCFDEYNILYSRDNSRISHGAETITATIALMNAGVQSSFMWTLFDQIWPNNHTYNADSFVDGDHRCGVMPVLTRTLIPHKSYYAFSLVSRFTGGTGTKVYEGIGEDCLHTTMTVLPDGNITVVVVNCKEFPDSFTLNFEKPINAKFNRYVFDPEKCVPDEKAEQIKSDKTFNAVDSLCDDIAPYGVTVYTTC